jgi:hypothetical protein
MDEHSPLVEAITLWEEITGVAPPDEAGFWKSGAGMGTWAIRDTYTELKEALELDPSEVTATLLMSKFVEEYLKQAKTSVADLLDAPDDHIETLRKAKRLRELLSTPDIVKAREVFLLGLKAALARYGAAEREDVQKLLDNPASVAVLRRDALRSLNRLRVDQFLEGDSEAADYKPIFVNVIHRWWNINSLLKAMTTMPSGVSLNLIRDPHAYDSYFAFAIRNGGNLFVLTDVPEHSHPLQGQMSRKPGRDLDRRAQRNWFPYDLLGMEFDDKDGLVEKAYSDETAVAIYQPDMIPLSKISETGPAETVWCVMMLDLIVAKFWRQNFRAKQLSYTGEMIKTAPVLLEHAKAAGLPIVIDRKLEMPALTIEDVTEVTKDDEKHLGAIYEQPFKWMEDRYKHLVPQEVINLIGAPNAKPLALDHKTGEIRALTAKEAERPFFQNEIEAAKLRTALQQMSSTKFGSPQELEADRRWLARYNVAEHIDRLAQTEFDARHKEVLAWYIKRAKANLPMLLTWAANDTIWVDNGISAGAGWSHEGGAGLARETAVEKPKSWLGSGFDSDVGKRLSHTFLRTHDLREKGDLWDSMARNVGTNLGGDFYKRVTRTTGRYYKRKVPDLRYDGPSCAVTDAKASYAAIFYPVCPEEIAAICACAVADLPDVLQHWHKFDRYRGNSILQRIDPMVWNIHNPWLKLDLRVRIPLSIRGMAQIKKAGAALPPLEVITEADAQEQDVAPTRIKFGGKG